MACVRGPRRLLSAVVRKVHPMLPEDKRYMEPGRSMMIRHGMIKGEPKEMKVIRPYQG